MLLLEAIPLFNFQTYTMDYAAKMEELSWELHQHDLI